MSGDNKPDIKSLLGRERVRQDRQLVGMYLY